jgi:acetyltransferase-like isoleucine patch superfamily enzyme
MISISPKGLCARLVSAATTAILRLHGVRVGRNVRFAGRLSLDVSGRYTNVTIGNNVLIRRDVELWTRGDGKIVIEDDVVIDTGCRLLAARSGTLRICRGAGIGIGTVINAGADVVVGSQASIAGYCYLQASNHGLGGVGPIAAQPNVHAPIMIGAGAWLGAHVIVLKGVTIGEGAAVGAGAVVNHDIEADVIAAGVPARVISKRGYAE